jgi:hypothetical protein
MTTIAPATAPAPASAGGRSFLLERVQPALSRFFQTSFARSFLAVAVGGAVIAALSAALGLAAA